MRVLLTFPRVCTPLTDWCPVMAEVWNQTKKRPVLVCCRQTIVFIVAICVRFSMFSHLVMLIAGLLRQRKFSSVNNGPDITVVTRPDIVIFSVIICICISTTCGRKRLVYRKRPNKYQFLSVTPDQATLLKSSCLVVQPTHKSDQYQIQSNCMDLVKVFALSSVGSSCW